MKKHLDNIFDSLEPQIVDAWNESCNEINFSQFIERIKNIIRKEKFDSNCNSNWKEEIKSKYLGRGLGWLYFSKSTNTFTKVNLKINDYASNGTDVSSWIENTNDANYIWLRFDSIQGNKSNPLIKFQIRINDSRSYDNKHFILLTETEACEGEVLGKSPFALGFEKNLKKNKNSISSRYSGRIILANDNDDLEDEEDKDTNNNINSDIVDTTSFIASARQKGKIIFTKSLDDEDDDEDDIDYINNVVNELMSEK